MTTDLISYYTDVSKDTSEAFVDFKKIKWNQS